MLEALDVVGGDDNLNDSSLASLGPTAVSFATNDVLKTFLVYSVTTKFLVYVTFALTLHLEVTPIINAFGRQIAKYKYDLGLLQDTISHFYTVSFFL